MKMMQFLVVSIAASLLPAMLKAQPPKPPSAEERLKHVTEKMEKDLQLTKAQRETMTAAYKSFFAEMDKLRSKEKPPPPPPPRPPEDKAAAEKLTKERDSKIKQALTDAQFKKFLELDKQMRPGGPGKPEKKGPPPPQS
jgi:hypothetical protein